MTEPRKPQDHLAKKPSQSASLEELEEFFSFTAGERVYVMPTKTLDVITVGFIRKNRRRDEIDYVFTCIEELAGSGEAGEAGEEVIAAIDGMNRDEFKAFQDAFVKHLGASLGE